MKYRMEIRHGMLPEPGIHQFMVLMGVGDDSPDFVFAEGFIDGAPGVAGFGGLARATGISGKENFHDGSAQTRREEAGRREKEWTGGCH